MKTRRGTHTEIGKSLMSLDKSALRDYKDLVLECRTLLGDLTKLVRDHEARQKKDSGNWAMNGDIGHVNEGLKELVRFLKS